MLRGALALLLAAAASAQPSPDPLHASAEAGGPSVVVLALGGTLASVVGLYGSVPLAFVVPGDDIVGLLTIQAGSAVVTGASLYVVGRLRDEDAAAGRAFRGALVGGALAMAATAALVVVIEDEKSDVLAALPVALGLSLTLPTALAVRGYRVGPARLQAPTGEGVPGLRLRLDL